MNIREATEVDQERIRAIADQSFRFSYSLSPLEIETILDGVFAADLLAARIENPNVLLLVAEQDIEAGNRLVGFVVLDLETSTVRWLHVDPDARDQGAGTELLERALETVAERGGQLRARVLQAASEGGEFCTRFGFSHIGNDELAFGEEEFVEDVYAVDASEGAEKATSTADSTEVSGPK